MTINLPEVQKLLSTVVQIPYKSSLVANLTFYTIKTHFVHALILKSSVQFPPPTVEHEASQFYEEMNFINVIMKISNK